jgi:DNA-binding CsgD family transcriptional regulator/tetratricopeptide (TPR) repeat protein
MAYLPIATAMVGRVAELTALTAGLDEAAAGRGSVAFLTGVPGVGKSRLAGELAQVAAERGMTTLWGRSFEGEGARSFAPWVEALGGYRGEVERDPLHRLLGQHAATVAQIVPALRDSLPPPPAVPPGEARFWLFEAVVHFLQTAAHERPILITLDDLHWADRASLALLRHLARHVADSAIAVVGTYGEEEVVASHPLAELVPMLRREAPCQHIALSDLSRAESAALVALALERSSTDQAAATIDNVLTATLVRQTGGNPFFIQEMVKDLVDTGQIVRERDAWVSASRPTNWDVPRQVREVIERRLRRLPPSAQRLLSSACACTSGFSLSDAQALTGAEEGPLLDDIDAALRSHLLRVVEPATTPARYDFVHALIRNALYAPLNPDRRARLHLRTAQALERGPVTDDLAGALATHYRLAGRFAAPERSIGYAVRAGEIAQASFAYEDAVTLWQMALDLMDAHAVEPERRAAVLEKLGDQLFIMNPADEGALAYHEQALALYEQVGQRDSAARIHFRLALLFASSERQDIPRALRHVRAAAASVPADEVSSQHAQIEALFALTCYYSLQLDEALAASQRAMGIVAGLDDEVTRGIVLCHRGFCLAAAGDLAAANALLAECYDIANRLNHPFFAASASVWAGAARVDVLDPVDACRWYENELAQPRTANSLRQRRTLSFLIARARLMLGDVLEPLPDLPAGGAFHATLEAARAYTTGDWPGCRAAATIGLDLARRRGNRHMEFSALHQLARLTLAQDDLSGAEDLLGRALELVAGQHRPYEALVLADLAVLYAGQGRTDEARAAVNQCRACMRGAEDWRGLAGRLALGEAALAAAERRSALAHGHFTGAIATFRRYQLPWDEAQALESWGAMLIRSGDRKAGDRSLTSAATIYRRHAAGYPPGSLALLPEALSHREVEVLCLVAAGRSNQEIADTLVLSVRTVERHLGHMYDKLGASGKPARAVATAYGIANGLVPAPTA